MKPLQAAPLTNEDFWIWDAVVSRCASNGIAHHGLAMVSDRRDAALMLERQQHLAEPSGDGTVERPVRMYQTVKSWWLLPLERHG